MANWNEYLSKIGLDRLYVAPVAYDLPTGYSAGVPVYLAPAAEASLEPSKSIYVQYADDRIFDIITGEGGTLIKLIVPNIDPEMLAMITGRVFDAGQGRMYDNRGMGEYLALSFRSLKSNGHYRYYQFHKGKFVMPSESYVTRSETPEPQLIELNYLAIHTWFRFNIDDHTDNLKRVFGDEDSTGFDATGWFGAVQLPDIGIELEDGSGYWEFEDGTRMEWA